MWDSLPDYNEVQTALRQQSNVKSELRIAELELTIAQAKISKAKPRDTASRIVGYDDDTERLLIGLQRRIIELKNQLDSIEADLEFLEFRKEIYKASAYKGRL